MVELVSLPSPAAETVGILNLFEKRLQKYGKGAVRNFRRFKKLRGTLSIWNPTNAEVFNLKNFSDCNNSAFRIVYEVNWPRNEPRPIFGAPRIKCFGCGRVYQGPKRIGEASYKGHFFSKDELNQLEYFLIGNNDTELALVINLLFLRELDDWWLSETALQTLSSERTLVARKYLEKKRYIDVEKLLLYPISDTYSLINIYHITNFGKRYLNSKLKSIRKHYSWGELFEEFARERIDELWASWKAGRLEERVILFGNEELREVKYNVLHIPTSKQEKILKKDYLLYWGRQFY